MVQVTNQVVVRRFTHGITVVEGDVITAQTDVMIYWVERNGSRVSEFTDIDRAIEIVHEMLDQD